MSSVSELSCGGLLFVPELSDGGLMSSVPELPCGGLFSVPELSGNGLSSVSELSCGALSSLVLYDSSSLTKSSLFTKS